MFSYSTKSRFTILFKIILSTMATYFQYWNFYFLKMQEQCRNCSSANHKAPSLYRSNAIIKAKTCSNKLWPHFKRSLTTSFEASTLPKSIKSWTLQLTDHQNYLMLSFIFSNYQYVLEKEDKFISKEFGLDLLIYQLRECIPVSWSVAENRLYDFQIKRSWIMQELWMGTLDGHLIMSENL